MLGLFTFLPYLYIIEITIKKDPETGITKMTTAEKLEAMTKKTTNGIMLSKNSLTYKLVKRIVVDGAKSVYPCVPTGSGRFRKNNDCTESVCRVLIELGISFEESNTAPRGGAHGNLITIK